ncbi:MAG TPA: M56 family metallopeptidase [Caulobacteraceae bacterium]|nr:M56 family metallopeptidase [Caulobacteraceae bacterium]
MTASVLEALVELNVAGAAAILLVLAVRKTVHRLMGPGAAYLLWAIAPVAMLATFIPARTILVSTSVAHMSGAVWDFAFSPFGSAVLIAIWLAGAGVMLAQIARRQQQFMHDVARGEAGPAVVGFFYPRVVTPNDFATRFLPFEQKLILAHEQVHMERHDPRINAGVALARCLFWFNPLVHIGAQALHVDQELSCDAAVIVRRPKARRVYAETLLKTQLAMRPLPVGCYWPAGTSHPLTERIAMLTRSPFSDGRRLAAAVATLALVGGGGFAAWAAQPAREVLADMPEVFVTFLPVHGQPAADDAKAKAPKADPDELKRQTARATR